MFMDFPLVRESECNLRNLLIRCTRAALVVRDMRARRRPFEERVGSYQVFLFAFPGSCCRMLSVFFYCLPVSG